MKEVKIVISILLVLAAIFAAFQYVKSPVVSINVVSDYWIDTTSLTFHITVRMPDSVLRAMADVGIEQVDAEFIGPTIDDKAFKQLIVENMIRRGKAPNTAAGNVGESLDIDVDRHKVDNGGIFDRDKRR